MAQISAHIHGLKLTDDTKLSLGVNVSMNGCLVYCFSPVIDWWAAHGIPCFFPPVTAGIDLELDKQKKMNG